MGNVLKHLAKETLKRFDISIVRHTNLIRLLEKSNMTQSGIDLILELPDWQALRLLKALGTSKSQLGQELFVLSELDFKTGGFFVEFGATDGVNLSNTYLLEKEFMWTGILAEPGKGWHRDLRNNRSCYIETDCVWRDSNSTLTFNEVNFAEHSTIDAFSSSDVHAKTRRHGNKYNVNTISLEDMLDKYKAPREIDYLSIDTEGSEYEILSNFDFRKYQIKIITCEHNFTSDRERICSLLTRNDYVRKLTTLSRFDDWYVKRT
jgi:FkbM family methyltransferase